MQPAYPSKTAVGHASIFTGTWPDIHGVSNNAVPLLPRSEKGPDKTIRGFDGAALQVEPLIVTAARQGKRVVSLWKVARDAGSNQPLGKSLHQ